jgi:hypothetical protein
MFNDWIPMSIFPPANIVLEGVDAFGTTAFFKLKPRLIWILRAAVLKMERIPDNAYRIAIVGPSDSTRQVPLGWRPAGWRMPMAPTLKMERTRT